MENQITGLLRLADVAEFLACSKSQVYRLLKSGDLRHVKIVGTTRVKVQDVINYCDQHQHERLI